MNPFTGIAWPANCNTSGTVAYNFLTNSCFPAGSSTAAIVYKGTWSSGTSYVKNSTEVDAAFFAGSQWITLVNANIGHQPDISPTQWALLLSGGSATIAPTTSVLKGDGTGNGVAATAGVDFLAPGTLPNGTTATTQAPGDNSAKVATDAFVLANGGSTSNCSLQTATEIFLTCSPYFASTAGALSTTTTGTNAPGTTINLAGGGCAAAGFDATTAGTAYGHEGVFIPSAGPTAGFEYVEAAPGSSYTNGDVLSFGTGGQVSVTWVDPTGIPLEFIVKTPSSTTGTGLSTSGGTGAGFTVTVSDPKKYIGTVTSCVGAAMVVSPSTTTSVTTGTAVYHDETAALNAATTYIQGVGTGVVDLPAARILIDGIVQDQGGANAVYKLPTIEWGGSAAPMGITLRGPFPPLQGGEPYGTILETLEPSSANLLGGYDATTGSFGPWPFTQVYLNLENMTLRTPTNSGMQALNCSHIVGCNWNNVIFDTPGGTVGTITTSFGFRGPTLANSTFAEFGTGVGQGYYSGMEFGEHSQITNARMANGHNGFLFEASGTAATVFANSISGDYLWCQECVNEIVGTGVNPVSINLQNVDIEAASSHGIYDPNNVLHGFLNWMVPYAGGAVTNINPALLGGANLAGLRNITNPTVYVLDGIANGPGGSTGGLIFCGNTGCGYSILNPDATHLNINLPTNGLLTATTSGTGSFNFVTNNPAGGFDWNFVAPSLANGSNAYAFIGKIEAPHGGVFFDWHQTASNSFGGFETYSSGDPIEVSGSQVWLNGGPVFIGNTSATGGSTLPSNCAGLGVGNLTGFSGFPGLCIDLSGNLSMYGGSQVLDWNLDTGLSRCAAGKVCVGNATAGDSSGTLEAAEMTLSSNPVPVVDTASPTASQTACIKSAGPPISIGTCSTVVGAGGACTCN